MSATPDPTVAVEEFRSRRTGRGVMVDSRPLDLGAIPLRRRIVDGQEQSAAGVDSISEQDEDDGGHGGGLATDTAEEVVVGAEVLPDAGGPPPTGDGVAAVGQKDADDDVSQPPGGAAVQLGGQGGDPGGPLGGQTDGEHPRPSLMRLRRSSNRNRVGRARVNSRAEASDSRQN